MVASQWCAARGVAMVLLLLCVLAQSVYCQDTNPITLPPVNLTGPPESPACQDPEKCCVHPVDSDAFKDCCEEEGCCLLECPETSGNESDSDRLSIIGRHCHAWECCVYPRYSHQHKDCCRRHGCCPFCGFLPFGCCYNKYRYAFRTVVEDLPDVCTQLVCAAKLLPHYPYLTGQITAVRTCTINDESNDCIGCPVYQCVDKTGIVRLEGDVWSPFPGSCIECTCRDGYVMCSGATPRCQGPPHSGCATLPGPCCPVYHCEEGCFDESGVFKPLGSEWPSTDPCRIMVCTETGIDTVEIACKPPPLPHSGCFLQPVPFQCCPEWNCSRCLDAQGNYRRLHEEWRADECTVNVCTLVGIIEKGISCPNLGTAPDESCFKDTMEGSCCEEWKCDGCWDGEVLHAPGSSWPSDNPCLENECTDQGVVQRNIDCPYFPRPHESCFEHIPNGECCPTWNCSGCLDEHGAYHPLYHEWHTEDCTTYVCHLNGITKKPCPSLGPAPHHSCYAVTLPGKCCREWKCDSCVDEAGNSRPLGSRWSHDDPCVVMTCMPGGVITTTTVTCNVTSPPHEGCSLLPVEGQCCKQWNCSGCWDKKGMFRKIHEEWQSDCTIHNCTASGIRSTRVSCTYPPRPHISCRLVLLAGDCCPSWDCKPYVRGSNALDCTDDNGIEHESGEQWVFGCKVHHCQSGVIKTSPVECPEQPQTPNCFEDANGCCSWNCSGCLEIDRSYHSLSDIWKVTPCLLRQCTEGGIVETHIDCPSFSPPSPDCKIFYEPEECCPKWNCRP